MGESTSHADYEESAGAMAMGGNFIIPPIYFLGLLERVFPFSLVFLLMGKFSSVGNFYIP